MLELEGLLSGISGKRSLWTALRTIADDEPRLDPGALDRLIQRAKEQVSSVEGLRDRAAREALPR